MSTNIILYRIAEIVERVTGQEINNARIAATGRRNRQEVEALQLFLRAAYNTQRFTLKQLAASVNVGHATVIYHLANFSHPTQYVINRSRFKELEVVEKEIEKIKNEHE